MCSALLVRFGLWTRDSDALPSFIERQLVKLGRDVVALRDQGRAVLLLDGLNEIPPHERRLKAKEVREMAEDERYAAVLVSCRERDFEADYDLPFDTLTLKPLSPPQIHRFLLVIYLSMSFLWALGTINYGTGMRHHVVAVWIVIMLGIPPLMEKLPGRSRAAPARLPKAVGAA